MKRTLDKSKLVKEMSRERIGVLPVTKVVPNKKDRDKGGKHPKRELERELNER